jgi:hypothetical protein
MPREKSIAHCTNMIAANSCSSASDDHESLGANQEHAPETQVATLDASSLSAMTPFQGGSLHSGIYLLGSIRLSGRMIFQCKFVFPSQWHVNF